MILKRQHSPGSGPSSRGHPLLTPEALAGLYCLQFLVGRLTHVLHSWQSGGLLPIVGSSLSLDVTSNGFMGQSAALPASVSPSVKWAFG